MSLEVIILAAGKGTRMLSSRPKVLHEIGGRPMLAHVIDCARALDADRIHVVYGHGGEQVPAAFAGETLEWVLQAPQRGTGHAVEQAMPAVADGAQVLILYGDVPLVRAETLRRLLRAAGSGVGLLTARLPDAGAYGRIVRDAAGRVLRIVEKKDADEDQLAIREINTGFMALPAGRLRQWLQRLDNNNAQGEYYLTDIIALAVAEGLAVNTVEAGSMGEIMGINSPRELAQVEREYQRHQAERLMEQGLTLRDPARFDLRGELDAGRDVVVDVNVILEGRVRLGDGVHVGPNCILRDCEIGDGTVVLANCVLEDARIGKACRIGPFARVRPETEIADAACVGNFVEIKKSQVGSGSKINHLSYVGDTTVGRAVNIGAGTITCNYDGANKHRTVIGDNAFIGSDTQLVAPVTVGEGATLGAGTTLTRDAPPGQLTLSRAPQKSIEGWQRPKKSNK